MMIIIIITTTTTIIIIIIIIIIIKIMKMNNGNSILDLNFHLKSQNRINYLHRMKRRKKAKRWCLRGCDSWNSLGSFMN